MVDKFEPLQLPAIDPVTLIQPKRKITGIAATLLPFTDSGDVDWPGFRAHIERTVAASLTPAVNVDTGYVNLLDEATRREVLAQTKETIGGKAFVADKPGDSWNPDACRRQIEVVQHYGGTPIIFQSYGLTGLQGTDIIEAYAGIAKDCARFIAFELGQMFAPFGRIYDLETYAGLLAIPQCIGAKHSSLSRRLEWQRIVLRNQRRPDFKIFTGNDLAIDMVMYGSDYLLGLSTFAPDLFARRDAFWEAGDPQFYELNDQLQYLGYFAFRPPVPAYKHSAAQFLKLRGWLDSDAPHPAAERRPPGDLAVLQDIVQRLARWESSSIEYACPENYC